MHIILIHGITKMRLVNWRCQRYWKFVILWKQKGFENNRYNIKKLHTDIFVIEMYLIAVPFFPYYESTFYNIGIPKIIFYFSLFLRCSVVLPCHRNLSISVFLHSFLSKFVIIVSVFWYSSAKASNKIKLTCKSG